MIDAQIAGAVGRITLNRPEAHNALTQAGMSEMRALLTDWARRGDIRAIVLTGKGRSFCSGATLDDVGADWANNPLTALCDQLEEIPIPTVARLNGGVYGGGVELALACDFRIGVTGMKAFVPPARLGIHYEPAGIRRALDRLGAQNTRRIFLLAERFEDEALKSIGFLDDLVTSEALDAAVTDLTDTLCAMAPMAIQGMKRTIVEVSRDTLDTEAARKRIAACFASDDFKEGLAAQREKRKPVFRGS